MKHTLWQHHTRVLPEEFFEAESEEALEPVVRFAHASERDTNFDDFFLELPLTPDCDRI